MKLILYMCLLVVFLSDRHIQKQSSQFIGKGGRRGGDEVVAALRPKRNKSLLRVFGTFLL